MITLYTECDSDFIEDYDIIGRELLEAGLKHFDCPCDCEISLYIVDGETIRQTNSEQRGIDKVTDVLSFPALPFEPSDTADFSMVEELEHELFFDPENGCLILGEIMICASKVFSQAEEYGHSPLREYAFLLIHSLLHLLGFDHEDDEDRLKMEEMQEKILTEAGYER